MDRLFPDPMHLRIAIRSKRDTIHSAGEYSDSLNVISISSMFPMFGRTVWSRFGRKVLNCSSIKIFCTLSKLRIGHAPPLPAGTGFTCCWRPMAIEVQPALETTIPRFRRARRWRVGVEWD